MANPQTPNSPESFLEAGNNATSKKPAVEEDKAEKCQELLTSRVWSYKKNAKVGLGLSLKTAKWIAPTKKDLEEQKKEEAEKVEKIKAAQRKLDEHLEPAKFLEGRKQELEKQQKARNDIQTQLDELAALEAIPEADRTEPQKQRLVQLRKDASKLNKEAETLDSAIASLNKAIKQLENHIAALETLKEQKDELEKKEKEQLEPEHKTTQERLAKKEQEINEKDQQWWAKTNAVTEMTEEHAKRVQAGTAVTAEEEQQLAKLVEENTNLETEYKALTNEEQYKADWKTVNDLKNRIEELKAFEKAEEEKIAALKEQIAVAEENLKIVQVLAFNRYFDQHSKLL